MKKFLLTFLSILALGITTAAAQDDATVVSTKNYEENLIITINGDSSDKIPANITVDHMSDGTINFSLKNFKLVVGEQSMYVGNINLNGVLVEQKSGYEAISTTQTIQIVPGNVEGVKEEEWLGPMLGDVPIVLNGKIDDTHLYVNIDIDMRAAIDQVINVVAGEDSGFGNNATVVSTKDYEENLIITINGDSSDKIPANITVDHMSDGTINFSLKNFKLVVGEQSMYVGNINLNGVQVEQENRIEAISTTQTIQIVPGNEEGVKEEEWLGPMLGDVPIVLNGKIDDTHLYVNIDIDMRAAINQVINVVAGEADKVTGIANATKQEAATNSGVYTLSGVRVADALNAALPKGVYIVSGRKILK